jgi:hypothetical protein
MPTQSDWRYCTKCAQMFYNGYPSKGVCSAGGAHSAQGFNFHLPHDTFETPTAQKEWRFCTKCYTLFFNGYPSKGACPAGEEHHAQGFNFTLPHDVAQTGLAQPAWRFCNKCYVMFFDGYPFKGNCKASPTPERGHASQGFQFTLPHDLPSYLDFNWSPIVFDNGVPVGGSAHLTIRSDGSYAWRGHFHDSGFPSYDVSIAWGVKDSQNQVYGFASTGHMAGTIESGSRDYDWDVQGRNDAIADRWAFIAASNQWNANAKASLDLGGVVRQVKEAVGTITTVVAVVGAFL